MISFLSKLFSAGGPLAETVESYRRGVPTTAFGVPDSEKVAIVSELSGTLFLVVSDFTEGELFARALNALEPDCAVFLPEKEELLLSATASGKEITYRRISALQKLLTKKARIAVVTMNGLSGVAPTRLLTLTLKTGKEYRTEDLIKTLRLMGYARDERVSAQGTFSVRGDVLDVFPVGESLPVRVDFFGDGVEKIRVFDLETGTTERVENAFTVLPAKEGVLDDETVKIIRDGIEKEIASYKGKNALRFRETCDGLISMLDAGKWADAFSAFSPSFCPLITAFPADGVVFSEPKRLYDLQKAGEKEHAERHAALYAAGETLAATLNLLINGETFTELLNRKTRLSLSAVASLTGFFNPLKSVSFHALPTPKYLGKTDELKSDLAGFTAGGYRIALFSDTPERQDILTAVLAAKGIRSDSVVFYGEPLSYGFIDHDEKLAVFGERDLFAAKPAARIKSKKQTFFSAPQAGDFAVHETYGIGKVMGVKRLTTGGTTKDYVALEYKGGDVLYVPVEQLDVLSKYVGSEREPALSKLGGKDFDRIKARVKESLKKLSFDLKELYRERQKEVGFSFHGDALAEQAFQNAFGYEDTPDQAAAVRDVLADMASKRVMDRLVCGDVGFGKTEVAFRAVFRAVLSGKQSVMLAPTTILAEQHYRTALARFSPFGVTVASLDRFKTKAEQKKILEDVKAGKTDFLIGTHRLLSPDVGFNDLGLLVLDEEQRFGVEHKEKIKLLKNNVDTLTLSATPIPRTLSMSLSGIRDISTIRTPPKERLPVQTYVTEESDALIIDAVRRETARGGQTFILYNRVESIYAFAEKLKALLPEVRLTVAHGQMDEDSLEKHVADFYNGKADVLLATTIIENGVDLPKANTMIVIDADRLGLSTLYQLKGRVGRSNRLAHAYFTFKKDKMLTDVAYERLSALMEFTEMGSGFKIAMRDLEIRGAGNLLGAEQHGHMEKIGYELYSKLLQREMEEEDEETPLELDLDVSAYIPDEYIPSSTARMDAYKEIAELETDEEAEELVSSLSTVYGALPVETYTLIDIALVKRGLIRLSATGFQVDKKKAVITLPGVSAITEGLLLAVEKTEGAYLSMASGVQIVLPRHGESDKTTLENVSAFLVRAKNPAI